MPVENLQDRAVQYVSGAMTAAERESFEVMLAWQPELRELAYGLRDAVATLALATVEQPATLPTDLKSRVLDAVAREGGPCAPEAFVVTDLDGGVHWVSDSFTTMCGYTLAELQGRKPGQLLQGPLTERAPIRRIGAALRAREACCETLLNYHKDGTPYWVEVRIAPVVDDDGQPQWFAARERRLMPPAATRAGL